MPTDCCRRVFLSISEKEWMPEGMVRLLHQGGLKAVKAVSSHEILISILQASQRNFLIYYHAGAVLQLILPKNTSALY